MADVINAVKNDGVDVIFAEELYGSEMVQTVQREADIKVCFLDTLVRGDYSLDSYINGMQENIDILKNVFIPSGANVSSGK